MTTFKAIKAARPEVARGSGDLTAVKKSKMTKGKITIDQSTITI